jgi:hypothetical protein
MPDIMSVGMQDILHAGQPALREKIQIIRETENHRGGRRQKLKNVGDTGYDPPKKLGFSGIPGSRSPHLAVLHRFE